MMKIAKFIILVAIYPIQLVMTLTPALAKQEISSSITRAVSNENLQPINNDLKYKQVETVDIFPEQSWASLRADMSNPVDQIPAPPVAQVETLQLPPPLPFTVVGEWLEDSQHIVVLESMGDTYLVCHGCELSNTLKVGDKLAQKYEIKSLDNRKLILVNEHGEEQSLTY